jgi:hypothetical protein
VAGLLSSLWRESSPRIQGRRHRFRDLERPFTVVLTLHSPSRRSWWYYPSPLTRLSARRVIRFHLLQGPPSITLPPIAAFLLRSPTMKLKEISRTATFAWSSSSSSGGDLLPLLATGTVSGALDETFSNVGQLEIWQPNWLGGSDEGIELGLDGGKGPRANVQTTARYVLLRSCLHWCGPCQW